MSDFILYACSQLWQGYTTLAAMCDCPQCGATYKNGDGLRKHVARATKRVGSYDCAAYKLALAEESAIRKAKTVVRRTEKKSAKRTLTVQGAGPPHPRAIGRLVVATPLQRTNETPTEDNNVTELVQGLERRIIEAIGIRLAESEAKARENAECMREQLTTVQERLDEYNANVKVLLSSLIAGNPGLPHVLHGMRPLQCITLMAPDPASKDAFLQMEKETGGNFLSQGHLRFSRMLHKRARTAVSAADNNGRLHVLTIGPTGMPVVDNGKASILAALTYAHLHMQSTVAFRIMSDSPLHPDDLDVIARYGVPPLRYMQGEDMGDDFDVKCKAIRIRETTEKMRVVDVGATDTASASIAIGAGAPRSPMSAHPAWVMTAEKCSSNEDGRDKDAHVATSESVAPPEPPITSASSCHIDGCTIQPFGIVLAHVSQNDHMALAGFSPLESIKPILNKGRDIFCNPSMSKEEQMSDLKSNASSLVHRLISLAGSAIFIKGAAEFRVITRTQKGGFLVDRGEAAFATAAEAFSKAFRVPLDTPGFTHSAMMSCVKYPWEAVSFPAL